jgi:hypothetical protein
VRSETSRTFHGWNAPRKGSQKIHAWFIAGSTRFGTMILLDRKSLSRSDDFLKHLGLDPGLGRAHFGIEPSGSSGHPSKVGLERAAQD